MTKLPSHSPVSTNQSRKRLSCVTSIGLDVFYPIVPDAGWVARIVPLGVRTVQLRIKDVSPRVVAENISQSLKICRAFGCQLIVNDYWQEAITLEADFVHLGQEDLQGADLQAIKAHGLKLGISTHDERELETGLQAEPDYVALGPIYETKLKVMEWSAQGLDRVTQWRRLLGDVPLVGIGGITIARATGVLEAGAQSVSIITDFINHQSPEERVKDWLSWAATQRSGTK